MDMGVGSRLQRRSGLSENRGRLQSSDRPPVFGGATSVPKTERMEGKRAWAI